jgi:hypothetical protein
VTARDGGNADNARSSYLPKNAEKKIKIFSHEDTKPLRLRN